MAPYDSDQAEIDAMSAPVSSGSLNAISNIDADNTNSDLNNNIGGLRSAVNTLSHNVAQFAKNSAVMAKEVAASATKDLNVDKQGFAMRAATIAGGPFGGIIAKAISDSGVGERIGGYVKEGVGNGVRSIGSGIKSMFSKGRGGSRYDSQSGYLSPATMTKSFQMGNDGVVKELHQNVGTSLTTANKIAQDNLAQSKVGNQQIVAAIKDLDTSLQGKQNGRTGAKPTGVAGAAMAAAPVVNNYYNSAPSGSNNQSSSAPAPKINIDTNGIISAINNLQTSFTDNMNPKTGMFSTVTSIFEGTRLGTLFKGKYTNDIQKSKNPFETLVSASLQIYRWQRLYGEVTKKQLNELIKVSGGQEKDVVGQHGLLKEAWYKNNAKMKKALGPLGGLVADMAFFDTEKFDDMNRAQAAGTLDQVVNKPSKRKGFKGLKDNAKKWWSTSGDRVMATQGYDYNQILDMQDRLANKRDSFGKLNEFQIDTKELGDLREANAQRKKLKIKIATSEGGTKGGLFGTSLFAKSRFEKNKAALEELNKKNDFSKIKSLKDSYDSKHAYEQPGIKVNGGGLSVTPSASGDDTAKKRTDLLSIISTDVKEIKGLLAKNNESIIQIVSNQTKSQELTKSGNESIAQVAKAEVEENKEHAKDEEAQKKEGIWNKAKGGEKGAKKGGALASIGGFIMKHPWLLGILGFALVPGGFKWVTSSISNFVKGITMVKKVGPALKAGVKFFTGFSKVLPALGKSLSNAFKFGGGLGKTAKILKIGTKLGSKAAMKGVFKIPVLGSLLQVLFAINRFKKGEVRGGLLEIASGIASLFPGIGTGISLAIDALNMIWDISSKDKKGKENKPQPVSKKATKTASAPNTKTEFEEKFALGGHFATKPTNNIDASGTPIQYGEAGTEAIMPLTAKPGNLLDNVGKEARRIISGKGPSGPVSMGQGMKNGSVHAADSDSKPMTRMLAQSLVSSIFGKKRFAGGGFFGLFGGDDSPELLYSRTTHKSKKYGVDNKGYFTGDSDYAMYDDIISMIRNKPDDGIGKSSTYIKMVDDLHNKLAILDKSGISNRFKEKIIDALYYKFGNRLYNEKILNQDILNIIDNGRNTFNKDIVANSYDSIYRKAEIKFQNEIDRKYSQLLANTLSGSDIWKSEWTNDDYNVRINGAERKYKGALSGNYQKEFLQKYPDAASIISDKKYASLFNELGLTASDFVNNQDKALSALTHLANKVNKGAVNEAFAKGGFVRRFADGGFKKSEIVSYDQLVDDLNADKDLSPVDTFKALYYGYGTQDKPFKKPTEEDSISVYNSSSKKDYLKLLNLTKRAWKAGQYAVNHPEVYDEADYAGGVINPLNWFAKGGFVRRFADGGFTKQRNYSTSIVNGTINGIKLKNHKAFVNLYNRLNFDRKDAFTNELDEKKAIKNINSFVDENFKDESKETINLIKDYAKDSYDLNSAEKRFESDFDESGYGTKVTEVKDKSPKQGFLSRLFGGFGSKKSKSPNYMSRRMSKNRQKSRAKKNLPSNNTVSSASESASSESSSDDGGDGGLYDPGYTNALDRKINEENQNKTLSYTITGHVAGQEVKNNFTFSTKGKFYDPVVSEKYATIHGVEVLTRTHLSGKTSRFMNGLEGNDPDLWTDVPGHKSKDSKKSISSKLLQIKGNKAAKGKSLKPKYTKEEGIAQMKKGAGQIGSGIKDNLYALSGIPLVGGVVGGVGKGVTDTVKYTAKGAGQILGGVLGGVGSAAWGGIKGAGQMIGGVGKGVGQAAWGGIKGTGQALWGAGKGLGQIGWGALKGTGQAVGGAAKGVWAGAKGLGGGMWDILQGKGEEGIQKILMGLGKAATETLKGVGKGLWSLTKGIGKGAWSAVTGLTKGVWSLTKGIAKGLGSAALGVVKGSWSIVKGVGKGVAKAATGMVKGAWSLTKATVALPYNILKGFTKGAIKTTKLLANAPIKIAKGIGNVVVGAWKWMTGDKKKVDAKSSVKDLKKGIAGKAIKDDANTTNGEPSGRYADIFKTCIKYGQAKKTPKELRNYLSKAFAKHPTLKKDRTARDYVARKALQFFKQNKGVISMKESNDLYSDLYWGRFVVTDDDDKKSSTGKLIKGTAAGAAKGGAKGPNPNIKSDESIIGNGLLKIAAHTGIIDHNAKNIYKAVAPTASKYGAKALKYLSNTKAARFAKVYKNGVKNLGFKKATTAAARGLLKRGKNALASTKLASFGRVYAGGVKNLGFKKATTAAAKGLYTRGKGLVQKALTSKAATAITNASKGALSYAKVYKNGVKNLGFVKATSAAAKGLYRRGIKAATPALNAIKSNKYVAKVGSTAVKYGKDLAKVGRIGYRAFKSGGLKAGTSALTNAFRHSASARRLSGGVKAAKGVASKVLGTPQLKALGRTFKEARGAGKAAYGVLKSGKGIRAAASMGIKSLKGSRVIGGTIKGAKTAISTAKNALSVGNLVKKGRNAVSAAKTGFTVAKTVMKGGIKTLMTGGVKAGLKAGVKGLAKGGLKGIAKKIPILGTVLSLFFAFQRFKKGEWGRGVIELLSGVASLVPGIGTGVSIVLDLLNMFLDKKMSDAAKSADSAKTDPSKANNKEKKGPKWIRRFSNLFNKAKDHWSKGNYMRAIGYGMAALTVANPVTGGITSWFLKKLGIDADDDGKKSESAKDAAKKGTEGKTDDKNKKPKSVAKTKNEVVNSSDKKEQFKSIKQIAIDAVKNGDTLAEALNQVSDYCDTNDVSAPRREVYKALAQSTYNKTNKGVTQVSTNNLPTVKANLNRAGQLKTENDVNKQKKANVDINKKLDESSNKMISSNVNNVNKMTRNMTQIINNNNSGGGQSDPFRAFTKSNQEINMV